MRLSTIRSTEYKSGLTAQRRRFVLTKVLWIFILILVVLGEVSYILFLGPLLRMTDIQITGVEGKRKVTILTEVNHILAGRKHWYADFSDNLFSLSTRDTTEQMRREFSSIRNLAVTKKYPHTLIIEVEERQSFGIWCKGQECHFFDREGVILSAAPQSSGFLLLSVEDQRPAESFGIDFMFLDPILSIADKLRNMGVQIKRYTIPVNSVDEFRAQTSGGYDIVFSRSSQLARQVEVLRIFLDDQKKDPAFAPQYIDIRIDGRVYYK